MKILAFSVYDSKAQAFITPFFSQTRGTAVRSFEQACNDPNHDFGRFAEDYTLMCVGEFDQENGIFVAYEAPENMGLAASFVHDAYTKDDQSLLKLEA